MGETVAILGAGATKSFGGPLTNEILRDVFLNKADFPNAKALTELEEFLQQNFHLPPDASKHDYPPTSPLSSSMSRTRAST